MAKKQLKMIYALKDGEIVSIDSVEKGLKCGCVCPACGEPLVAKKGEHMMKHFAHHSGHSCEYGYETSLHLAAKDILSNAKKIVVPEVVLNFPYSYKRNQLISESKEITIDKVVLEKQFNDIVPDVVVYSGKKKFFVEIYVTHKIDDAKLKKLKKLNVSTIEIDFSKKKDNITTQELTDILLNDSSEKTWKYNSVCQKYLNAFYAASDKRDKISRGFATHVDDCPIKQRMYHGKPYANFIDDCLYCDYCISYEDEDTMLCSGRTRIATIADFKIPEDKRIKDSDNVLSDMREQAVYCGHCPQCGHDLVKRNGPHGVFFGCRNYPHCQFTTPCNEETGTPIY